MDSQSLKQFLENTARQIESLPPEPPALATLRTEFEALEAELVRQRDASLEEAATLHARVMAEITPLLAGLRSAGVEASDAGLTPASLTGDPLDALLGIGQRIRAVKTEIEQGLDRLKAEADAAEQERLTQQRAQERERRAQAAADAERKSEADAMALEQQLEQKRSRAPRTIHPRVRQIGLVTLIVLLLVLAGGGFVAFQAYQRGDIFPRFTRALPVGQIAFYSAGEHYLVTKDGSVSQQDWTGYCPSFSPDGQYVAMHSGKDAFINGVNSGSVQRLSDVDANDVDYGPDGVSLVYERYTEPGGIYLYSIPNRFGNALTSQPNDVHPDFSPYGNQIVFVRDGHLYVVSPGREATELRALSGDPAGSLLYGEEPDWSPDGRRIAFTEQGQLRIYDRITQQYDPIPSIAISNVRYPIWSPDGQHIMLLGRVNNRSEFFLYNFSAGTIENVSIGFNAECFSWGINPDSEPLPTSGPSQMNLGNAALDATEEVTAEVTPRPVQVSTVEATPVPAATEEATGEVVLRATETPKPSMTPTPSPSPTQLPSATPTVTTRPTQRPTATPVPISPDAPEVTRIAIFNDPNDPTVIIQRIFLSDPNGDATLIDYEIVSAGQDGLQTGDASLSPSNLQLNPQSNDGYWNCGSGQYAVTLRVVIRDAAGNVSQPYTYTLLCGEENATLVTSAGRSEALCLLQNSTDVNLRAGPSTTSQQLGFMRPGITPGYAQTTGSDGMVWYRVEESTWVRSDLVTTRGNACATLPRE